MYDVTGKHIGDGDRYELGELLGSGAMGLVYKAVDHRLRREVVVKLLSPSLTANEKVRKRFASEALIQANLLHPNIVRAVDWIDTPQVAGIVIDYVDGPTLEGHLASVGRLSPRDAVALLQPVISAVALAHRHGVVHRDLKPANVLLDTSESSVVPKVADFGIAKILGQDGAGMTRQGAVLGTPAYMPPEQLRGLVDEIDHTADVYALGVILHQLLSGEMPYEAHSEYEVTHQVLSGETLRPLSGEVPGVTPHLDQFIARATSHDKGHRFESCKEMGQALDAALDSNTAAPTSSASEPERPVIPTPQLQTPAPETVCEPAEDTNGSECVGHAARNNRRRYLVFAGAAVLLSAVGLIVGLSASGGTARTAPSASAPALQVSNRAASVRGPASRQQPTPPPAQPTETPRPRAHQRHVETGYMCGSTSASPAGIGRSDWLGYTCLEEDQAHNWSRCLARSAYSDVAGTGCPGTARCCPAEPFESLALEDFVGRTVPSDGDPGPERPFLVVAASLKASRSNARQGALDRASELRVGGFPGARIVHSDDVPEFDCCYYSVIVGAYARRSRAEAAVDQLKRRSRLTNAYVKEGW